MQYLEPFLNTFNTYLNHSNQSKAPFSLYDPCQYLLNLGGKRIRPALLLMACEMYDKDIDKALPAALAVEMFHNFTLMHDDIMDKSPMRRGQATVHEKYGDSSAILSGDVMLIQSYALLQTYPIASSGEILQVFTRMAIELCEGQRLDMDFEDQMEVTIHDYLKMIEKKTAVLLAASLQIGAIIGNASSNDKEHIYQFGKNIGIAFQIQDDILDTFGDHKVGKVIGGDILRNKKTYLYLKALELADHNIKTELNTLYGPQNIVSDNEKISRVKSIFNELVIKEYATQVMEAYRDLSISHIMHLELDNSKKKALIQFAEYLVKREN